MQNHVAVAKANILGQESYYVFLVEGNNIRAVANAHVVPTIGQSGILKDEFACRTFAEGLALGKEVPCYFIEKELPKAKVSNDAYAEYLGLR